MFIVPLPSSVIQQNYARIQGVEKELQGLQLQLKLTSGPKRSALEMLRRKIEAQTDRVIAARLDSVAAQKVSAQVPVDSDQFSLEMLHRKIEAQTDRAVAARLDSVSAQKVSEVVPADIDWGTLVRQLRCGI